jgi:L-histidine N-alpha-methyltransferase
MIEGAASRIDEFANDVHFYLQQDPKQLPSRYLYDALGSALFEAICHLPWYPITRAEHRLLRRFGNRLLGRLDLSSVIELGCGNGDKLVALLEARPSERPLDVHLVDLSSAALEVARGRLESQPCLNVVTHVATYEAGFAQAVDDTASGQRLVLFLGSNIGNFDPPASSAFLRGMRSRLRAGDAFLLGADLVKPVDVMELAYDDPLGVTAAFNLNLLVRANRELGANFSLDQFAHRGVWNEAHSRMEMHLVARSEQHVVVPAAQLSVKISAGESLWTESSYKYRVDDLSDLLTKAGFGIVDQFVDERDPFALTLARAV